MKRFNRFACIVRIVLAGGLLAVSMGAVAPRLLAVAGPTGRANVADPAERIRFLRAEIARHDELYYRKAQPEITDAEYDALKSELTTLGEQFPEEAATLGPSPIGLVGDDRTPGFAPARHRVRMLSLEKVYSESALREFCARVGRSLGSVPPSYVIEPKFDGLGVSAPDDSHTAPLTPVKPPHRRGWEF